MRYDLNFWEEPDWHREGTLSPVFILCALATTCTIIGIFLVSVSNSRLGTVQRELETLTSQNQEIMAAAAHASKLKKQVAEWEKVCTTYDELVRKNFVWSSQLELIQKMLPDDILIESLAINTTRNGDTLGSKGVIPLPAWSARLTLEGVASGENPPNTINLFLDSLQEHELLSQIMVPYLANTASESDGGKRFRIDLNYTLR